MNRITCNPLDLAYRYQEIRFSGVVRGVTLGEPRRSVHREAADPSIVLYRGRYYLFASMSRGFWHSPDLVTWHYVPTEKLPPFDYAPDVREVNGALLISASRKATDSPFFRSVDPLADDFKQVSPGPFPFWDPSVFQDDDGRIYLYWGCDDIEPLYGIELDDELHPIGERVPLVSSDAASRGWERLGEDYVIPEPATERERLAAQFLGSRPYIEGAWMTRHGDTYYLQYAAPGAQYNTYADGYFTSKSPLGPFTYSTNSPFSSKPGGFLPGAGHGSTFQDEYGNWWHASTMRISVNDVFERRVGVFPAGFDSNGVLTCNQNFADYPYEVPAGPFDPWARITPEWMLLSSGAETSASTSAPGHGASLAATEDVRTWWASSGPGAGEWLSIDLGQVCDVAVVQVNLADHDMAAHADPLTEGSDSGHTWRGIYAEHTPAEILMTGSLDGELWETLYDGRDSGDDRPHATIVLDAPRPLRHVRVQAHRLPFDGVFAVSGLRVFGRAPGTPPTAVVPQATRVDPLMARLTWSRSAGAIGYNVRYGAAPDALYRSWLVYDREALDVPSLNADEDTWFAVDSFNGAGVTLGRAVCAPTPSVID
ncbi:family 43 glycosylhydrolase [Herbiconiux ginsengi]|uniref:Glycosyl hydrolases family 43 n=1 Tax=Herbiconiux ginsengi TaxID=381665 RepID=A0A1H3LPL4_9MICO|nr:family 43 glycosylhydrolase [Herbiconiux ginsengi]SDY66497.1 Glycosyl hydrolases family 43 [Herbiconiux ginsengi]